MKLLIITQAIDLDNPVLGFFHRWVLEFAKHSEQTTVICLEKGRSELPPEIKVLSLGKEKKLGRWKYLLNFYKFIWQERKNYDTVFVHMNQEYILLAGWWWRLIGKKVFLWRNHLQGNLLTRLAVMFSSKVFCTSPRSFTAKFSKTELMPVGIDTDFFSPDPSVQKKSGSILFLGRIASVKNVDIFVEALNKSQELGVEFTATIAGSALVKDLGYEKMIREKVIKYGLASKVRFVGSPTREEALTLYREHELYVNLTPSGSMDKTIFEAMACGTTPLVPNQSLKKVLGDELVVRELDVQNVVEKIGKLLGTTGQNLRDFVVKKHSLEVLVSKLENQLLGEY